jgi:hypothetical protein
VAQIDQWHQRQVTKYRTLLDQWRPADRIGLVGVLFNRIDRVGELSMALKSMLPPRRGDKSDFDWSDVRDFVRQTMDKEDDFRPYDTCSDWRCQADLERVVRQYIAKTHGDRRPAESTIRDYASRFYKEWKWSQHDKAEDNLGPMRSLSVLKTILNRKGR